MHRQQGTAAAASESSLRAHYGNNSASVINFIRSRNECLTMSCRMNFKPELKMPAYNTDGPACFQTTIRIFILGSICSSHFPEFKSRSDARSSVQQPQLCMFFHEHVYYDPPEVSSKQWQQMQMRVMAGISFELNMSNLHRRCYGPRHRQCYRAGG